MWIGGPDGGGCDHPTGSNGTARNFAKTVASNLVGAGVAPQTDTHRVGKSVTATTGGSAADTEAHSATQDWDYRHEDFVVAVASGCTGCGFVGVTGPRSSGLGYSGVFSCGKSGHGVGRCPELNETFPFMLPGWMAKKVGGSYLGLPQNVAEQKTETDPGRGVNHPDP